MFHKRREYVWHNSGMATRWGEDGLGDIAVINEVLAGDTYLIRRWNIAPKVIVDIGAHVGCFAVAAHARWPESDIVCVEPNPSSVALLERNAPFATIHNKALSRYESVSVMTTTRHTGGTFVSAANDDPVGANAHHEFLRTAEVKCVTLDDVCAGRIIDLLKMDCEGCEKDWLLPDVLESCGVKRFVAEYHLDDYEQRLAAFRSAGWHVQGRFTGLWAIWGSRDDDNLPRL